MTIKVQKYSSDRTVIRDDMATKKLDLSTIDNKFQFDECSDLRIGGTAQAMELDPRSGKDQCNLVDLEFSVLKR